MPGRGPAPKTQSRTRHKPQRGEWAATPGTGWQHGPIPDPPDGLKDESRAAWYAHFEAWYAAHWRPENLPSLRSWVLLYDQVQRGEFQRHTELRLMEDTWGMSPKGQQDRRWTPPKEDEVPKTAPKAAKPAEYGKLRVVE